MREQELGPFGGDTDPFGVGAHVATVCHIVHAGWKMALLIDGPSLSALKCARRQAGSIDCFVPPLRKFPGYWLFSTAIPGTGYSCPGGEEGTEEAALSGDDEGCLSRSIGTVRIGLIGVSSNTMLECLPNKVAVMKWGSSPNPSGIIWRLIMGATSCSMASSVYPVVV